MAQWSINIDKWAKLTKEKPEKCKRAFVFLMYSKIVQRTPVDEGRARGNWNVSVGKCDTSINEELKTAKYRSIDELPIPKGDTSMFISNNLIYMPKLEYGGYGRYEEGKQVSKANGPKTVNGYSKQAPKGMLGLTVAEASKVLEQAVRMVK